MRPQQLRRRLALMTFGAIIVGGSIGVKAHAEPAPIIPHRILDYAQRNEQAMCDTLTQYPSVDGVQGVVFGIMSDGFTGYEAGEALALGVIDGCPQHIPLLQAFIDKYSKKALA